MSELSQHLQAVMQRIADAERHFRREPGSVRLLAVSKTFPATAVAELFDAGQPCFGESYLQEALLKVAALVDRKNASGKEIEWHFIAPIQSNKTRAVAENFAWVHGLDRLKTARRLSAQRPVELPPLNVCIQVNISGEASKAGTSIEALPELATAIADLPGLRLRGLMTLPARSESLEAQREPFRRLRMAFEDLRAAGLDLDTLSMGMSGDLEAAIAEGATIVRVGTALFGPREPHPTGK
jgi:pyridoxal phosphate enzyme (YggS family)